MSRSEMNNTGNIGIQKTGVGVGPPQPVIQSMHLGFGPEGNPVYKPVSGNGNGNGNGEGININIGEGTRKKRGRPRKYEPEGPGPIQVPLSTTTTNTTSVPPPAHVGLSLPSPPPTQPALQSGNFISQTLPQPQAQQQMQGYSQSPQQQQQNHQVQAQQQAQAQAPQQQQQNHQVQSGSAAAGSSSPSVKKARGRPPGSGKKHHLDSLGAPGIGFTPHVITVNTGEDVASRIMSFSQTGPRAICILSANGAISNVTLRQAATSGGSVTYEGRFEILSLSGSFMLSDSGGQRSRSGGLSVSLAGPDGRVLGGGIAGLLTAASPVQVVVGSFIAESQRETKVGNPTESMFGPTKPYMANVQTGPSSPTSRGTLSGSSGGGGSPLHQSAGAVNSTPLSISNLPWK